MTSSIPQRVSLVSQTASLLRASIEAGSWGNLLPGEIALCNELQISRVTLRAALAKLEREGWFTSHQGQRRQIAQKKTPIARVGADTTVVLLSPVAQQSLPASSIIRIVTLRECLASAGFQLAFVSNAACFSRHPARALEALDRELHAGCYILYLSTEAMQRWFSERKISCVVTGSCHPNVNLPSVDIDYSATCHHAVGRLAAAGRKRLALLMPRSDHAGNLESERGFMAAGQKASQGPLLTTITHHDGNVESICRTIDRLIGGRPPVDGLLIAKPTHVITTICHLLRRGVRIPDDISVVSRDDDPALDSLVPCVSRYQTDPAGFARKVAQLTIDTLHDESRRTASKRFIPRFLPGRTLR